jgi:DNA helicase-2/ATP-dependent DNA helicase PcrA
MLLEGVGPARARRALDELMAGGLLSATQLPLRWSAARAHLPAAAHEQGDALVAALAAGPAGPPSAAPAMDAERLRDALAPVVRAHYPDGAVRVQDLDALCGLAGNARDLRTFVAELLLDPPACSADLAGPPHQDDDWLVLSTVHSAKGLEWQAVHLIAAYDGNFPADMAAGTSESLARARRSLSVYVPRRFYFRRDRRDGHGYGKPSRFLGAAAQACCEIVHLADDPAAAVTALASAERRIAVSVDELFA